MATQVGEAVIKLTFDGKEADKEVQKTESKLKSFGSKVGSALKATIVGVAGAATASAAGVAKLVKESTKLFADYEQLVGGVETLFKDSADAVFEYADKAFKTAGLSANEYMETVTSFSASLLQGLGGDTAAAAKIADQAIVDMSDNANKMGTSMELIQYAYQGFAKQNYTMLDNLKLGYGGTASEMARLINDSGVLGNTMKVTAKNVNSVSFDKMIEAIHVVQTNLGITGTTAKEASDTISGSVGAMKAAWGNLLVGVADDTQDFNKLVANFMGTVKNVAKNLLPTIKVALEGVANLIQELAPIIAEKAPQLIRDLLPVAISVVTDLTAALIKAIPMILEALVPAILEAIPVIFEAIKEALPGAFLPVLGVITGALILGKIKKALKGIFGKESAKAAADGAASFAKIIGNALKGIFDTISHIFKSVSDSIGTVLKNIGNGIANFIKAFASPDVLLGAAGFAAAAASIAVAILAIGSAVGAVYPALESFMNGIIIPLATFIQNTVINVLNTLTDIIIRLTNQAFIPLGNFLANSFALIIQTITNTIVNLTQGAVIPLINTLSGAFIGVIRAVGDVINNIVNTALRGLADIISAIGDGFMKMGYMIRQALDGVSGVLSAFADLIRSIATAAVAIVSLVTGRSINYGSGYAHLFAEGGKVEGPGTATSDSIPARLSNGEFVIKASSAKMIGYDTLDDMNESGRLPSNAVIYNWAGVLANSISGTMEGRAGGEINVFMTNQINNRLDAQDIGRTMIKSIREAA